MNLRPSPYLLAISFLTCFIAGLATVILRTSTDGAAETTEDPPPTVGIPATGLEIDQHEDQKWVLLLGVDDLRVDEPRLLAVWYLTYRLPGKGIYFVGLPLDYGAEGSEYNISELFQWNAQSGPASEFLDALADAATGTPDVVAVLDRSAFAASIDFLGGLRVQGSHLSGEQVLATLNLIEQRPDALLGLQAEIVEALAERAGILDQAPDITDLAYLVPDHARLTVSVPEFVSLVTPLLPLEPGSVQVHLLTVP